MRLGLDERGPKVIAKYLRGSRSFQLWSFARARPSSDHGPANDDACAPNSLAAVEAFTLAPIVLRWEPTFFPRPSECLGNVCRWHQLLPPQGASAWTPRPDAPRGRRKWAKPSARCR